MANSNDITRKFLDDIFNIRMVESETASLSHNVRKIVKDGIKSRINELSIEYSKLESPEKEYLESVKSFYGVIENKNKYDYSQIEKGKLSLDTPLHKFRSKNLMSVRSNNCLRAEDIKYLGELIQWTENDLLKIRNFGKMSLDEVKKLVSQEGYSLGIDINYVRPEERK
jgi:DNA-directed RNA polymerase alpha subunit